MERENKGRRQGNAASRENLPVGNCIRGWGWALEGEGTSVEETRESSREWNQSVCKKKRKTREEAGIILHQQISRVCHLQSIMWWQFPKHMVETRVAYFHYRHLLSIRLQMKNTFLRCLSLSNQQSKTHKHSVYYHIWQTINSSHLIHCLKEWVRQLIHKENTWQLIFCWSAHYLIFGVFVMTPAFIRSVKLFLLA